jgi:hypothetical protein
MSERIRTIVAVAILTIAIWVWADLEQTAPPREVQIPVKVVVPPDYIVKSVTPAEITVKFQGPKGEVEDLAASPEEMVCRLELTESELKANPNRVVMHAREGLTAWASRRIIVLEIRGEHDGAIDGDVVVRVDHLVRVKVRVEPKITGAVATVATVQPPEVEAQVAESELNSLPEARRFAVAPLVVSSLPSNPQVEREVPLDRKLGGDGGIAATFDPPIVKITARLESALVTKSLGRFPVLISAPPEVFNRYRVIFQPEADRFVELEVQGPAPDVEHLNPQDLRVQLLLTPDDKPDPDSWIPRQPVVVNLPPGVKLAKPLPTVNFNLEKLSDRPAGT